MIEHPNRVAAKAWIEKADGDLRSAEILIEANPPETDAVTFHSQQAGEKYFKAFMAFHGLNPPKEHNLEKLLDLILPLEDRVGDLRMEANRLTPFAVMVRYPFTGTSPSVEEAQQALRDAGKIKELIVSLIKPGAEEN